MKRFVLVLLLIATPARAADVSLWLWPSEAIYLDPPAIHMIVSIMVVAIRPVDFVQVGLEYDRNFFVPFRAVTVVPHVGDGFFAEPDPPVQPLCSNMGSGDNRLVVAQFSGLGSTGLGVDCSTVKEIGFMEFDIPDTTGMCCEAEPIKIACMTYTAGGLAPTEVHITNPPHSYLWGLPGIAFANACEAFWYGESCNPFGCPQGTCIKDAGYIAPCPRCPPTITPAEAQARSRDSTTWKID